MDAHLDAIEELTTILESGIRYSIRRVGNKFMIRLQKLEGDTVATTSVDGIEEAASWLREQVKVHYPDSAYARRLLGD